MATPACTMDAAMSKYIRQSLQQHYDACTGAPHEQIADGKTTLSEFAPVFSVPTPAR